LDPESLFCELDSLKKEQQILLDEYNSYKERLPALEQQLRDRTEKLEEDTEMMNQLAQLKARESKVK
jgi:Skp family chaperone for outer membrane proteins